MARSGPELPASARESIAAVLRRAREKHGQDVRSVAQVLRIRQAYLEALESGERDKLPGTAYALGFLRTYAEYLGLNANHIVDRYKEEVQAPERPAELVFPEPMAEGRIPGGAIILVSVVLLAVAYGGWLYLANQGRSVADLIPAMPERIQTFVGGERDRPEAAPETAPETTVAAAPEQAAPEPTSPAKIESQQTAEDRPAEPEPASPPAPAAAPEPEPEAPQDAVEAPVQVAPDQVAAGDTAEAAPEAAERPEAPRDAIEGAEEAFVQGAPVVRDNQVAVLPSDGATDFSSGLAASPDPEPEQAPILEPEQVHEPAPTPIQAQEQAQESTPTREQARAEPRMERTVVIPAPPAAPRSFARPGVRTPRVYGESNQDARIVLRALQDSWVQVRDGRDALLLTRVLRSGDSYRVPDRAGLTLLTGNAGGIELEVDGIRLAPLGPSGAVRRQIALDPSTLLTAGTRQ